MLIKMQMVKITLKVSFGSKDSKLCAACSGRKFVDIFCSHPDTLQETEIKGCGLKNLTEEI